MPKASSRVEINRDFLRSLTPTGKFQDYSDGTLKGFGVRVTPVGTVQFTVRFRRPDGTFGRKRIGSYPEMMPGAARDAAKAELDQTPTISDTTAIIEEKKRRRVESVRRAHGVPTLRAFLEGDYTTYLEANGISTANAALVKSSFPEFLDRPLDEITPWLIEGWKSRVAKTGVKPKTIANKLHALQGLLRVATDAEHISDNPARKVKRNGKADVVVRYLSADERARLYSAMEAREEANRDARHRTIAHRRLRKLTPPPSLRNVRYTDHLQPLVVCALNTGLRKGELLALQWDDVDFEHRTIHVRRGTTKDDERRDVPITDELFECFSAWKPLAHRVFVFGNPETESALTDFGNAWDALLEAAKISGFRFHDCRHDYASRLVVAGVDLNRVRALLGHSDIKTVLRYAHLAPDHLHDAINVAFNAPRRDKAKRARTSDVV
ncbi:site-specific integrase [Paraburkholderia youngii]|uniref:Site-specific integrase n=1 Tax=Paraburkholderia youngii TaxID=2782701 RepID=A0A7Y6JZN1_9BURK|nr:site-specific integrase [Paraburkholderia youngii]NUY01706.1 site-specific integrase [Paraburkholderia youngii]